MAKPIKILESYYPMIQYLIIIIDDSGTTTAISWFINAHVFHLIKENLTNERILQTDVTLDLFYFCWKNKEQGNEDMDGAELLDSTFSMRNNLYFTLYLVVKK